MGTEEKRKAREKKPLSNRLAGAAKVTVAILVALASLYFSWQLLYLQPMAAKRDLPAEEIGELYARGSAAVEAGDYGQAIDALREIDGYLEADTLYAQAIDGLSAEAIEKADRHAKAGEYIGGLAVLREAKAILGADSASVDARISTLEQAYTSDTFAAVEQLLKADDYEQSLSRLTTLHDNIDAAGIVQIKIADVTEAYHQHFLTLAREALAAGEPSQALSLLDEAEEHTGTSDALQALRQEVIAAHKADFLARYEAQIEAKAYGTAISIMEEAEAAYPEDTTFPVKREEAEAAQAAAEAIALAESGRFALAIRGLDDAIQTLGELEILSEAQRDIVGRYKASFSTRYASLIDAGLFGDAIALMVAAEKTFPTDRSLSEKRLAAQVAQAGAAAEDLAAEGAYAAALARLDDAIALLGARPALAAAKEAIAALYREDYLARYAEQYEAGAFDAAAAIMEEAEAAFPADAAFAEMRLAALAAKASPTQTPTLAPTATPTTKPSPSLSPKPEKLGMVRIIAAKTCACRMADVSGREQLRAMA